MLFDDVMPTREGQEVENPHYEKIPVVLLLDSSGSMQGEPIEQINRGLKELKQQMLADEQVKNSAEICVIEISGRKPVVRKNSNFVSVDKFDDSPLKAGGKTPLRQGIELAVNKLTARKKYLKDEGTNYFRPWLILITDGAPTDLKGKKDQLQDLLREQYEEKHILPWAFGTDSADFSFLKEVFPESDTHVYRVNQYNFSSVFEFAGNSIGLVSQSRPGERVTLPNPANLPGISTEV